MGTSARRRQLHGHQQPSLFAWGEGEGPVVRLGDALDYREAKALAGMLTAHALRAVTRSWPHMYSDPTQDPRMHR